MHHDGEEFMSYPSVDQLKVAADRNHSSTELRFLTNPFPHRSSVAILCGRGNQASLLMVPNGKITHQFLDMPLR